MSLAEELNKQCKCTTLDKIRLQDQLEKDPLLQGLFTHIQKTRPHLFSETSVYITETQFKQMKELIIAIESVIALPSFVAHVRKDTNSYGPRGVFMGYDFHLGAEGPQLIEINTNAGGALLNLELTKAQLSCCPSKVSTQIENLDYEFIEMFRKEWSLQRGNQKLNLVAIIDNNPQDQYLYPEFQLFQKLFRMNGIDCVIADPSELSLRDGKLLHGELTVDLIYNRLTDFYLTDTPHLHLKEAYEKEAVVVTPAPYHHAIYANKMNLVTLTHAEELRSLGVNADTIEVLLKGIPETIKASADLYELRKNYFFKPFSGHGSKATYRGDKLTSKVWADIVRNDYIAQKIVPPPERNDLKFDIRAYVYEGKIQLLAARLYSGQTTNFRTAGGGFAPVFII